MRTKCNAAHVYLHIAGLVQHSTVPNDRPVTKANGCKNKSSAQKKFARCFYTFNGIDTLLRGIFLAMTDFFLHQFFCVHSFDSFCSVFLPFICVLHLKSYFFASRSSRTVHRYSFLHLLKKNVL